MGELSSKQNKEFNRKMHYFFLYKPYGMLSQFTPDQEGQVTLADLEHNFPKEAYPVGRLDSDSEGLLLLTDDKSLNAKLLNPKSHFPKTYWVQVEGAPEQSDLDRLRRGQAPGRLLAPSVGGQAADRPHRTAPIDYRCN